MSTLESIASMPLTEALGWTLLNFVWQGAVIAIVTAGLFTILRNGSPGVRYVTGCLAMVAMMIAPLVTLVVILRMPPSAEVAAFAPPVISIDVDPVSIVDRLTPALPALTAGWLVGTILLAMRLLLLYSRAEHLKRAGIRPAPRRWQETVDDWSRRLDVRPGVRVVETTLAAVPTLIGWLRPVILMPTAAAIGLTPGQLRAIIVHELAHVRRHDYVVNLVQAVFEATLFYHPAVWWLSSRIRTEREYCCDDVAVEACGDALAYARALAALDALRSEGTEPALAVTGGPLMQRIHRLVGTPASPSRPAAGVLAPILVALSIVAAVTATSLAVAVDEKADGKRERVHERPSSALDEVDVVGIVEAYEDENAGMLALLRESGLDNRVLLVVLREFGADPEVLETIERASKRAAEMHDHVRAAHEMVEQAIASGKIAPEEAAEKLHRLEVQVQAKSEARSERLVQEIQAHRLARKMHEDGMSEREIEAALAEKLRLRAQQNQKTGPAQLHAQRADENLEAMKQKLDAVQAQLHVALEAGKITPEEAHRRLARLKGELAQRYETVVRHEDHLALVMEDMRSKGMAKDEIQEAIAQLHGAIREGKPVERILEMHWAQQRASLVRARDDLAAARDKVAAALDAGAVAPEEARRRLEDLGRKTSRLEETESKLAKQLEDVLRHVELLRQDGATENEISEMLIEKHLRQLGWKKRMRVTDDIRAAHDRLRAAARDIRVEHSKGLIDDATAEARLIELKAAGAALRARLEERVHDEHVPNDGHGSHDLHETPEEHGSHDVPKPHGR